MNSPEAREEGCNVDVAVDIIHIRHKYLVNCVAHSGSLEVRIESRSQFHGLQDALAQLVARSPTAFAVVDGSSTKRERTVCPTLPPR